MTFGGRRPSVKDNLGGRRPLVDLAEQCHTQIKQLAPKILRPKEFCWFQTIGTIFLGSMLPQYMALSVSQLVTLRQKKNLGHFEARYEVELWYADCSHKYKIN